MPKRFLQIVVAITDFIPHTYIQLRAIRVAQRVSKPQQRKGLVKCIVQRPRVTEESYVPVGNQRFLCTFMVDSELGNPQFLAKSLFRLLKNWIRSLSNGNIRLNPRFDLALIAIENDLSLHWDLQTGRSFCDWDRRSSRRWTRLPPVRKELPKCTRGI